MLALVGVLLAVGLVRQFAVSNPFWVRLDRFGIVPQWKFFAQARMDRDLSVLDDMHLLVRLDDGGENPGLWRELPMLGNRPIRSAVWNPHGRSRLMLGECMQSLALFESTQQNLVQSTALVYLTLLRHCLEHAPADLDQAIQFAVVLSRGRAGRSLDLRFLSAWHRL